MRTIIKCILIFFLLIFLHNCLTEKNPIQPKISESDLNIKNMLLGKWKFSTNIRQFNDDGTFFDSIYANSHPPLRDEKISSINICTEIDSNGYFLNRVVYGKYVIKDSILKLRPINYMIDCNPLKAPACYIYFDHYIEINSDTMKLNRLIKWQKTSNNTQGIWGSWESSYWVWAYHEDLPTGGAPQLVKESMTFYQDSAIFHHNIVGLPYSGILWRTSYTYDPPILNVHIGNEKYYVSLNENTMTWLDLRFTYKYIKK
jgi:hypothetical protein